MTIVETASRISRIAPPMASLWRLKRRHASWRVLRALSEAAAVTVVAWAMTSTPPGWLTEGTSGMWSRSLLSGIADPRVQDGVHDVRHQVEDDHEGHGHHHPRENLGIVAGPDGIDEVLAHAGPLEDLLGDDEPGRDPTHVQGHLGGQRDQGVAHGVADHHPALPEALGPGGAQEVAVQDLEHAGPHEAAVHRDDL